MKNNKIYILNDEIHGSTLIAFIQTFSALVLVRITAIYILNFTLDSGL